MEQCLDHGQIIYVICHYELDSVIKKLDNEFRKKMINGKNINYIAIHQNTIDFYKSHADSPLFLGYCYWNGNKKNELPYLLNIYKSKQGCQRFQFEYARCLTCKSDWRVANPMYLGLYPNYNFQVSELKYPLLNCPDCGGKLSRPAIWCERISI